MNALMLEVSLLGVGTVLLFERGAWSKAKSLRQVTNEYAPPSPPHRSVDPVSHFPYTHMPSKRCQTLLYHPHTLDHVLCYFSLPGQHHNNNTPHLPIFTTVYFSFSSPHIVPWPGGIPPAFAFCANICKTLSSSSLLSRAYMINESLFPPSFSLKIITHACKPEDANPVASPILPESMHTLLV